MTLQAVLNQIDPKRAQAYGGYKYGYSGYGRYGPHSYGQDPKDVADDSPAATRKAG